MNFIRKNDNCLANGLNNKNKIKEINRRPRKNINYENPKNLFYKFVNPKVAFAS